MDFAKVGAVWLRSEQRENADQGYADDGVDAGGGGRSSDFRCGTRTQTAPVSATWYRDEYVFSLMEKLTTVAKANVIPARANGRS